MNRIMMVAYNNLELTKKAVASALAQDLGDIALWVTDNGSKDETYNWLIEQKPLSGNIILPSTCSKNESPIKLANEFLRHSFAKGNQYILAIPNDVVIPPILYRKMLEWPRGFVTASMTEDPNFRWSEKVQAVNECTPLSVVLIRKWAHDALIAKDGYFFDERYFHYASDCDLALRMAACGIRGVQLDLPYYHVSSATLKNAPQEEHLAMCEQANRDRELFTKKWGFPVDAYEYGQCAVDINFRGGAKNV